MTDAGFSMSGQIFLSKNQQELLEVLGFPVPSTLPASQLQAILDEAERRSLGSGSNSLMLKMEKWTDEALREMRDLLSPR